MHWINCGKEVAGTDAKCGFCGSSIFLNMRALLKSQPTAGGAAPPVEFEQVSKRSSKVIPGLVVGLVGLVVLLFVVIPQLMRPRFGDGYGPGMGALRTINEAAATYDATYGHGFPPTLAALGPPKTRFLHVTPKPNETAAGLIGEKLASGTIPGWRITYTAGSVDRDGKIRAYTVHADPINRGVTGDNHYFTDQSGVIRQKSGTEASENDSPIAG